MDSAIYRIKRYRIVLLRDIFRKGDTRGEMGFSEGKIGNGTGNSKQGGGSKVLNDVVYSKCEFLTRAILDVAWVLTALSPPRYPNIFYVTIITLLTR